MFSHVSAGVQVFGMIPLLSPVHWQRVALEVAQQELEPEPIWDSAITDSGFSHNATENYFLEIAQSP